MSKRIVGIILIVVAFLLLGIGSFLLANHPTNKIPAYVLGTVPTSEQLSAMTSSTKQIAMLAMLQQHPFIDISSDDKATQVKTMRDVVSQGTVDRIADFASADQQVSGAARLVHDSGKWYVTLSEDFDISPGPNLHVYVSSSTNPLAPEVGTSQSLDVGPLLSFGGGEVYPLPADFDVTSSRAVIIYSPMFRTVFATASFD